MVFFWDMSAFLVETCISLILDLHRSFRLFNIILHKWKLYTYYHPEIASYLELYTCNLNTIPLLIFRFPPPCFSQSSHTHPHLSFNHQVPDSLVPWGHFLSWSGQSKTCADVQNMIYFMSLTFLLHFFPLRS